MKTRHDKEARKLGHRTLNGVCAENYNSLPKSQHTPTPWNVQTRIKEFVPKEQGGGLKVLLHDSLNYRVGTLNSADTEIARANAAFIVKAVNCHEEMLKLLKAVHTHHADDGIKVWDGPCDCIIGQAIAKAEGK